MNEDSGLVLDIEEIAKDIKTFIKNDNVFEIFDDIETITSLLSKCVLDIDDSKYIMQHCKQHYDDVGCFKIFKSLNVDFHDNIVDMISFIGTCIDSLCASPLRSIRNLCVKVNDYIFNISQEIETFRAQISKKDDEFAKLKAKFTRDARTNFIELCKSKLQSGSHPALFSLLRMLERQSQMPNKKIFFKFAHEVGLTEIDECMLHDACIDCNFDLVESLVEAGYNVNILYSSLNAVLYSIQCYCKDKQKQMDIFKYLIEKGLDINHRDNKGRNAILLASKYPDKKHLIEYFVSLGLSANSVDNNNRSCIYYAARNTNLDYVIFLYEHGADPYIKNTDGLSPMHAALQPICRYQKKDSKIVETLKFLISVGCNKNDKTKDNETCLHFAAKYGYPEVVDYLIYIRADLLESDNSGKTPLDYAKEELNEAKQNCNNLLFFINYRELIPKYEKIINSLTKAGAK